MNPPDPILTERLELVPATSAMLAADRGDRKELGRLLRATIPLSWPPALLDEVTIAEFLRLESTGADRNFRTWYWVLRNARELGRILVGSGGVASCQQEADTVIIGYSIAEGFEGRGYATEAVRHTIPVIFSVPGFRRILATTFPELKGSIRVLEKNGFRPVPAHEAGSGIFEGTIAFMKERPGPP